VFGPGTSTGEIVTFIREQVAKPAFDIEQAC
jgi:hypothetical protein